MVWILILVGAGDDSDYSDAFEFVAKHSGAPSDSTKISGERSEWILIH